eukprot:CAMPEP_0172414444 /NCGR_PEP_ID=MMETSP1064-20121228/1101_1 /TAXON_ID=202472 /ORGANISM="Aulacoseira subarctica , Strain CCAP 1002/5" /LENGTH=220 /DNA_ID=CAMNT_0013151115 /DNA_START=28 /DNA_END=690 /DNA_ORIENTATION=+
MPSSLQTYLVLFISTWSFSCHTLTLPSLSTFRMSSTQLRMGIFDGFRGGARPGNGKLDEEWEKQQDILRQRRAPKKDRDKYFEEVERRRVEATVKQNDMWAWQTKTYKKGEDPIDEWKKRRANGQISDLENQYGDPKEIGGIPLPGASFGVGGEFGVGGKFDNGGRFDLRLPYADQGYVDEDSDFMGKLFGKKKEPKKEASEPSATEGVQQKKTKWPWEK